MTKARQQLLLDILEGKYTSGPCTCHGCTDQRIADKVPTDQHHPRCARRHEELCQQLVTELDAHGPFTVSNKLSRYRASNGQFASLAIVSTYGILTAYRRISQAKCSVATFGPRHGLYEAHLALHDDSPIRTTPTPAERRHTEQVSLLYEMATAVSPFEGKNPYAPSTTSRTIDSRTLARLRTKR